MSFKRLEADENPLPWLQKKRRRNGGDEQTKAPLSPVRQETEPPDGVSDGAPPRPATAIEASRSDADKNPEAAPVITQRQPEPFHADQADEAESTAPVIHPASPTENGTQSAAPIRSGTTSTRLRLSEILREAAAQRAAAEVPPARDAVREPVVDLGRANRPREAEQVLPRQTAADDEYPTLLERPRDGTTEPFLDMMPEAMADDVDQDFKELELLPKARDPLAAAGPAPYVAPPPSRERRFNPTATGRIPWRIVSAFILALSLAGFILAFTGWVLTSEDSANEVNRRIAAELTEVDRYLVTNHEVISQTEPNEDGQVPLPDFPLAVSVTSEEAQLPASQLRDVILDDAAELMYAEGVGAYGDDAGLFDDFDSPGLVRFGIEVTQDSTHNNFLVLTILAGLVTMAAAVGVLIATPGPARLTAFGSGIAVGGALALLASLVMRFLFDRAASRDGDALAEGLGDIATDVSFLFTRNSLAFLAIGLLIITAGFVMTRLARHQGQARFSRHEPANVS